MIIEPLVDGFYAWLHTAAPVPAAMNLAFLQLPLLESYLQSPQVHINPDAVVATAGLDVAGEPREIRAGPGPVTALNNSFDSGGANVTLASAAA